MDEKIQIESLAYGGDGVGHLGDGRTAFVPATCPGDEVTVRIVEDKKRFVRAEAVEIVTPSNYRIDPHCDEAADGNCGGCPWEQIDYPQQLRSKRRILLDALVHTGRMERSAVEQVLAPECVTVVEEPWNCRNKVEFEVGEGEDGHPTLGMHSTGGDFHPIKSCRLAPEALTRAPRQLGGALRIALGEELPGLVRVGLRSSARTKDVEVALWTAPGDFPRARVAKLIGEALPVSDVGVTRVLLKEPEGSRKVVGIESLAGRGVWHEQVAGFDFLCSAPSFFQVVTGGADALVRLVLEGLQVEGTDTVFDLYSGIGTFTLPLASSAGRVVAVEMEGSSIRDLRRNLEDNGLEADVCGGDVARELAGLGAADAVVVDPPRVGLSDAARKAVLATRARRIAYVSCDPATLARDLAEMTGAGGYNLASVTPVDMFPQTYHVETVAVLSRKD
ncbi:MAG: 23S rRNA (uracil(1939)-C(5))-methyltransferase RlmD [Coriobacteriaceae bacterium]|nr:23S rRNA (uracil(1939)-C(5))-methyltransferase RlmD [Coriobacteriaceae bacterium]